MPSPTEPDYPFSNISEDSADSSPYSTGPNHYGAAKVPAKPSRAKKFVIRGLIALVVLALLGGTGFMLSMKIKYGDFQPPHAPANVIVVKAEPRQFSEEIEAIGTAESNESANITATVTETVKAIHVEEGQSIKKDDPIADLNDDEQNAQLQEAAKSYHRYNELLSKKLGSAADRDTYQAQMDVAQAQLNNHHIVAPFDGVIGLRHVSVGDLVTPGTLITTLDDISKIKLDFAVPETYLAMLKIGMQVKAESVAFPDEEFTGQIYAIDPRVDPDTRSVMVRSLIENPDHRLRPGLLMTVQLVKRTYEALAIPEEAVGSTGDAHNVLVVGADHKVALKPIEVGLRMPGYIEVKSGLEQGDQVIAEGQMKTGPGAEVNITGEKTIDELSAQSLKYSTPRKQEALKSAISPNAAEPDGLPDAASQSNNAPQSATPPAAQPSSTEPSMPENTTQSPEKQEPQE